RVAPARLPPRVRLAGERRVAGLLGGDRPAAVRARPGRRAGPEHARHARRLAAVRGGRLGPVPAGNPPRRPPVRAATGAARVGDLTELDLRGNDRLGFGALEADLPAGLHNLGLAGIRAGENDLQALAERKRVGSVRRLDLSRNPTLDARAMRTLSRSAHLTGL